MSDCEHQWEFVEHWSFTTGGERWDRCGRCGLEKRCVTKFRSHSPTSNCREKVTYHQPKQKRVREK